MFAYLSGEIDYESFLRRQENGTLHYPVLTLVFVLGAALLLVLTLMNLLIGLAVGDIEKIRSLAIIKQCSERVRMLCVLDQMWSHISKGGYFNTVKIYPNRNRGLLKRAQRFLLKEITIGTEQGESKGDNTTNSLLQQQQEQLQLLSQQVTSLNQTIERLESALDKITTSMDHQEQQ